jgi:hypothetical protein
VLAALLAVAALAVVAIPASASVPAANTKFCNAFLKIGKNSSADSSTVDLTQAKSTLAKYKAATKYAPAKVKKAGKQIVSVLGKIAKFDPKNPTELADFYQSSDFKNYGKAITTFFLYASQQCSGA